MNPKFIARRIAAAVLFSVAAAPCANAGTSRFMTSVAAGSDHTCALNDAGGVMCWGASTGDGTSVSRDTPVDVTGLTTGVAAIAAGAYSTCALMTSGGVKCWGQNLHGQLGDGTTSARLVPVDVVGLANVVAISVGTEHACAVVNTGIAKCWGKNDSGQLGDGTTTDRTVPTNVSGLPANILAVAAGGSHSCALTAAGAVKCWGLNLAGQLGNGTTTSSPLPVDSGLSNGVSMVSTGGNATGVVMSTGAAKNWGDTFAPNSGVTPTDIPGLASGVASISMGGGFQCVVTTAGAAKCWGNNPLGGVIGVGSDPGVPPPAVSTPTDVATLSTGVAGVSVGNAYACAVTTAGGVKCWGNPGSQLGGTPSARGAIVTVNIPGITQTVDFPAMAASHGLGDAAFAVSATASSGLPVSLSSQTPAVCTVAGSTVTLTGALGICTIAATQSGDSTFAPATTTHSSLVIDAGATLAPRLGNIATRMQVLTGNDQMIAGFAVRGPGAKTVVVRGRGPSLTALNVPNALQDPSLLLHKQGASDIGFNDNWQSAANASVLRDIGFAPSDPRESAIMMTLQPGLYSAVMSGVGGTTGVGLIEVFEIDAPDSPLINISTRGKVLTASDVMIGGFIINGNAPQTVIVRARGPSLPGLAASTLLANPVLQLVRSSDQSVIATNDDWQDAPNAADIAASGYQPLNPNESAVLITLPPGAYTAIVSGAGGTTGIGLVEVFAQ